MRAGSAGISHISGAWAAAPTRQAAVRPQWNCEGRVGDGSEDRPEGAAELRTRADQGGECCVFEYQRCMGYDSFGQTDVCGQWN
jgi:hypothetical protein